MTKGGAFSIPRYSKLSLKVNIIYHIPQSGRGNSTIILVPNAFEYLSSLVRDRLSYACSIRHTLAWDIPKRSAISSCVNPISSLRCLSISAILLFNRSLKPGRLLCLYPGRIHNILNGVLSVVKDYFCNDNTKLAYKRRSTLEKIFYRKNLSVKWILCFLLWDLLATQIFYFPNLFNWCEFLK